MRNIWRILALMLALLVPFSGLSAAFAEDAEEQEACAPAEEASAETESFDLAAPEGFEQVDAQDGIIALPAEDPLPEATPTLEAGSDAGASGGAKAIREVADGAVPKKATRAFVINEYVSKSTFKGDYAPVVGDRYTFEANFGPVITWCKSANNKIAYYDADNDEIVFIKAGSVKVTLQLSDTRKIVITFDVVNAGDPSTMNLPASATVLLGGEVRICPGMAPQSARNAVLTWKSSNPKVASVVDDNASAGRTAARLIPHREGKTTITGTSANRRKVKVVITVVDPYKVSSISFADGTAYRLHIGATHTLDTIIEPSTADSPLTWKSSNDKVVSVDDDGKITPHKPGSATITVTAVRGKKTARIKVTVPKSYALVIGNANYRYGSKLPACVNDAKAMEASLKSLANGYKVTTLKNVTASKIRSAIKSAYSNARSDDISLFYYSGHGLSSDLTDSQGALIGIDDSLLTMADLAAALSKVPGRIIVLLDSCHSGAAISTKAAGKASNARAIEDFNRSVLEAFSGYEVALDNGGQRKAGELKTSKFIVISASRYSESSWCFESYDGSGIAQSAYTLALVQGIGSSYKTGKYQGSMPADTNGNSAVSLKELFDYISVKAKYYTTAVGQDAQHAMYYGVANEDLFFR